MGEILRQPIDVARGRDARREGGRRRPPAFGRAIVKRIVLPVGIAAIATGITARPAWAQSALTPRSLDRASFPAIALSGADAAAATSAPAASAQPGEGSLPKRFIRDVGSDYLHFLSKETAWSLGVGGLTALAVHPVDKNLSDWAVENDTTLTGGDTYGSQYLHIPVALGVWVIGAAAGSGRFAETGRDLLRAQISVVSWTYAIKFAADRTRPNGDPNSFPSGHASTSFATAMVLQEHFGWKAGAPAFAAATYTLVSRVTANQHWASDVVFGAAVGIAAGRTVTIQLRETRLSLGLLAVPGGGGVLVSTSRLP
jgi:membrane-associated phospholipid phosphatase